MGISLHQSTYDINNINNEDFAFEFYFLYIKSVFIEHKNLILNNNEIMDYIKTNKITKNIIFNDTLKNETRDLNEIYFDSYITYIVINMFILNVITMEDIQIYIQCLIKTVDVV
jgi:hypothetical protein